MSRIRREAARRPLRVLLSAGPTREPIDPVRFLSNYSTGFMGAQLAAEALERGHRVTVIRGPGEEPMPTGARVIPVERAHDMEQALRYHAGRADVVIMAAAVSDFRASRVVTMKLPRRRRQVLRLEATPDIIARLPRRTGQLFVGFALESDRVIARAERKLRAKRLDLLLAQRVPPPTRLVGGHANGYGSPFGRRKVRAWLLTRCACSGPRDRWAAGAVASLGTISKSRVACVLLDKIEALWYGQRRSAS